MCLHGPIVGKEKPKAYDAVIIQVIYGTVLERVFALFQII